LPLGGLLKVPTFRRQAEIDVSFVDIPNRCGRFRHRLTMMPVSWLIALAVAFGWDPPQRAVPQGDVGARVLETLGGITLVAALAFGLGCWVALRVSHSGYATSKLRRHYVLLVRLLTVFSLIVYGFIIHWVRWAELVRMNWGLSDWILVDDLLVFLPYVLIQLLVWWGLYFGERAIHVPIDSVRCGGLLRYLTLKTRQAFGLILPVVLLYAIKHDVIFRFWPRWEEYSLAEPIEIVALGGLILSISPLFVRLAWPARSLPPGELRTRLERVARRAGFRFSDVLVWDTGYMMVNACVTGILPGFRYVLLSDALVETLDPMEAVAVFGHEMGHVAHRHLLYFALFFVGSLGVLTLLDEAVARSGLSDLIGGGAVLGALGVYFWLVFGRLSRTFERQADVFGSKVVSCQQADCPPHVDVDSESTARPPSPASSELCPVGIRIFTSALANVARYNGFDPNGRSWRHGSIASRIAFLEGLERQPEKEERFQSRLKKMRLVLGVVLGVAVLLSFVTRSWAL
jgi:STE24 endopeptidase